MAVTDALRKMFGGSSERYDEQGEPIKKKTIEERLLESHLERERKKKIREALNYYEKKHWKEMTYQPKVNYSNKVRRRK